MTSEKSESSDQKEALIAYWLEKAHESLKLKFPIARGIGRRKVFDDNESLPTK